MTATIPSRGFYIIAIATILGATGCQSRTPLDITVGLNAAGEAFDQEHSETGSVLSFKVRNNTLEDWHRNIFMIECRDTSGKTQTETRERSELLGKGNISDEVLTITSKGFFPKCISVKLTVKNDKGMAVMETLKAPNGRVMWVRTDITKQDK